MKLFKSSILIFFSIFIYGWAMAQTSPPNLPTVIGPSPAVANFIRYGEIPIDYSTGVPSISIPLYTAKSRELEVPISISYHASGIKVEDRASIIGLGWVLNAGGFIGVSQMGNGGESPSVYQGLQFHNSAEFERKRDSTATLQPGTVNGSTLQLTPFYNFGSLIEYQKIALGGGSQSNRYTFQLPDGQSGVFRYDYASGQLINLPYSNIKIQKALSPATGFKITDEKGIVYTFTAPANAGGLAVNSYNWDLISIVSADKTDTIRFVYKSQQNIYSTQNFSYSVQCGKYDAYNSYLLNAWGSYNDYQYSGGVGSVTAALESILDSVITCNTVVKFTVAGDRQDMGYSTDPYRMTNMAIYSRSTGNLIKSYAFNNNSYFGTTAANNLRLQLAGLTASGSDQAAVENYSLIYNSNVQLPPYPENLQGSASQFAEDYWGYFNGNYAASLVPIQFVPASIAEASFGPVAYLQSNRAMDRTPNPTYAQAAMLQEIDYPTGGKTIFTFEPNYAANAYWNTASTQAVVGGFRIKNISNYSNATTLSSYKTYEYSPGVTRTIEADLYWHDYRVCSTDGTSDGLYYYEPARHIINSTPYLPLTADNGPPVLYNNITEYIGDATGNTGKTIYSYITPPAMPPAKFIDPNDAPIFRDGLELDMGNYIPHLGSKTVYKYVGGNYIPVNQVQNTYTNFLSDKQFYTGMHTTLDTYYSPETAWGYDYWWCSQAAGGALFCSGQQQTLQYPYYWYWTDLHATQQISLLTQAVTTDYSPDGTQQLANTTTYNYANAITGANLVHVQPTQKTNSSSTGDSYITNFQYPSDFSTSALYDTMVSRNMLYPVINQSNYKNSTGNFLNSQTTNYYQWSANLIAPQTVQIQKGTNAPETRTTYNSYDSKGNIQSVSKTSGPKTTYQWGYKQSYPVAQATNAPSNDIFYDSFEEGDGNGTYNDAKTGHYSYNGSPAYSKILSGLDNGGYLLSYWLKSAGTWTLQVTTVTVSSGGYTISISGQIDDVRFYPALAQMTTYTFDPLIGITSTTDAKGEITFYEYDPFQRLINIKDKDGNIIKSYCYNYANQLYGCAVAVSNPPQNTYVNFTLTNNTGVSGFVATFTSGATVYSYNFLTSGTTVVQILPGTYTVTVNPINAPTNRKFLLGSRTPVTSPGTTFSNVLVSATNSESPLIIQNP